MDLSKAEQDAADRYAAELAEQLFNKAIDELAEHQLETIHRLVRERFV